ncbi:MAG: hypothetical protein ACI4TA_01925 [Acetatifactor sp.]
MRESLFQYLVDNCGDNQIIIAENEIPETDNMDYSKTKLIGLRRSGGVSFSIQINRVKNSSLNSRRIEGWLKTSAIINFRNC